jgi:hypothetical protein
MGQVQGWLQRMHEIQVKKDHERPPLLLCIELLRSWTLIQIVGFRLMEYIVKKGRKMINDQHTFTKTISEKWEPTLPQKFK